MKRFVAFSLILALAVASAGCNTTFNRVGAVIVAAAEGYDRQAESRPQGSDSL